MNISFLDRNASTGFSNFSQSFTNQNGFSEFISDSFSEISQLKNQIEKKKKEYTLEKRTVLVESFTRQLKNISQSQKENLQALANENCFTITTGHQLSLLGSPLFLVYKILHAVKLSKEFNASQNEYSTVPVFWLASEDHDFDEVKSAHLFSKTFTWNSEESGAVGRFETQSLKALLDEFKQLFVGKNEQLEQLLSMEIATNYGVWFQQFISQLFADFGVLVLNPDDQQLKALFSPIIEKELFERKSFECVQKMNEQLAKINISPQAQAKEINFFYLIEGKRTRIEWKQENFQIGEVVFSEAQLRSEISHTPEKFSPNVILRPVYQETILPNVCYIGGGGEMNYWIQLKGVFDLYNVEFPLLQQRVSFHLIDASMQKKMDKLPFKIQDYFLEESILHKRFLTDFVTDEIELKEEYLKINELKDALLVKVKNIDANLLGTVESEFSKMNKSIEMLESKIRKSIKAKHEQDLKQISFVSERFLPNKTLQERYFHFLHFVPNGDFNAFFKSLLNELNPFEGRLIVLSI